MNKLHRQQEQFTIDAGSFLPQHLRYVLVKKSKQRRRTVSLIIKPNNTIITLAPFHMDRQRIIDFIHSKKEWLKKRTTEIQKNPNSLQPKTFTEGELFPYLGLHYKLKITQEIHKNLLLTDDSFLLSKKNENNAKQYFANWYKKQALGFIREKTAFYSNIMNLFPEKIKITSARQRWGSCTHSNTLNFSWRVISLPSAIIDYIVVHEIAHIGQKNHSKKFWNIVSVNMSDYKTRRKWLREQSKPFNTLFI